jgi:hypothetical protein
MDGGTPAANQQLLEQLIEGAIKILERRCPEPGHEMTSP